MEYKKYTGKEFEKFLEDNTIENVGERHLYPLVEEQDVNLELNEIDKDNAELIIRIKLKG